MVTFSDMFGYQCAECSQERIRTHHYTASLNDNTRGDINTDNTRRDMNTAAGRTQDTDCNPVKPTQLPGIHTIFSSRYPFYIDECDSSIKDNLKCDKSIKSTINVSTTEGSPLVGLIKNQDSLNIDIAANSSRPASKKNDVCRTCHESFSEEVDVHKLIYTGEKSFSSIHTGEKSSSSIHNGEKSSSSIHNGEKSSSSIHNGEESSSSIHNGEKSSSSIHNGEKSSSSIHNGEKSSSSIHNGEKSSSRSADLFQNKGQLNAHNRCVHKGEKRFVCNICGKQFHFDSELAKHLVIHTASKPFFCNICGKSFKNELIRFQHVRNIHDNDKNYICEVCGKRFFQKFDLSRHIKTHYLPNSST